MTHIEQVVIIEDDHILGEILQERVNSIPGFKCKYIFAGPLKFLTRKPEANIILLDIVMPEMNGLDAIEIILKKYPDVAIIMNTIKDDTDTIFTALKRGALGYIDKQSIGINLQEVLQTVANGGAYMTPSIARKVFNSFQEPKNHFEKLTERERDVTNGILEGLSYKLIAQKHEISIDTVRMNVKNIYKKLKINSKGELFNLAKK